MASACIIARQKDPTFKPNFKHGHRVRRSPTYRSWQSMITRCTNPNAKRSDHYGGANPPVLVCDHWLHSFEAFLADMGERPKGATLGRLGDVGNYSCGQYEQCKQNGWERNCSWQTRKEQQFEQRTKRQLAFLAE